MDQGKKEEILHTCVDCGSIKCNTNTGVYPPFCLTQEVDPDEKEQLMDLYAKEENKKVMTTAAQVEYEGYCRLSRVEETIDFAKRMGFHKIGIATCVGLLKESRILAKVLRANGFEVYGAGCKTGAIRKTEVGIAPECESIGPNMCNPIYQAKLLTKEKCELNIVVGLCVGHDSLFYKYASGLTTTLVVKDRVTGNNPVAALYTADSYYKKKLYPAK